MKMKKPVPRTGKKIPFEVAEDETPHGVTVVAKRRQLNVYSVTEDELENLYSAGNYKTLDVGLFSLCIGILVTLVVTMATIDIADARLFATFSASSVVMLIASLFFAFRSVVAWRSANRRLQDIKRGENF